MSTYRTRYQGDPTHPRLEDVAKIARDRPGAVHPQEIETLARGYLDLLTRYEDAMAVLNRLAEEMES